MKRPRRRIGTAFAASVLLLLLVGAASSMTGGEGGEARGSRSSWTIDAFDEASIPVGVMFETSDENGTYHISVPSKGSIDSASMTIEGVERYSLKGTKWDFTDNTSSLGWESYTKKYPPTDSPGTISLSSTSFSEQSVWDVSRLDDTEKQTSTSWVNQPPPHEYPFHLFDIKVNRTEMVHLVLEWHGYGYCEGNDSNTHGAELWAWNRTADGWEVLSSYARNDTGNVVRTLRHTLRDPYHYTSLYGHVNFLVFGQRDETQAGGRVYQGQLGTDYVAATVLKNDTLQWPAGVEVAIADGSAIWWNDGDFIGTATLDDGAGFRDALQAYVDSHPPSQDDLVIPMTFRVREPTHGILRVTDLDILVREPNNQPPQFLGASTVRIMEDEDKPRGLDLWEHFDDDFQGYNLTYQVEYEENASFVHAEIHNDGHHVNFLTVAPDWAGNLTFRFNATDVWGLATSSGVFTLIVEEVNDPPSIVDPGDQYLDEDAPFELNITATDPDLVYGDVLTFEDDADLFDIDPLAGRIAFTPLQADVGDLEVTVTVRDGSGRTSSVTFLLSISDINDRPRIVDPGLLVAYEGRYFSYNFTSTDEDPGETATWQLVGGIGTMFMGAQNGRLTWIPTGEHVGVNNVSIIARDRQGAADQLTVSIEVLNVNDPPKLDTLHPAQLTEGKRFVTVLTFSDEDIGVDPGESHEFRIEPALFPIAPDGTVDFTPGNEHVGTHHVNVTIKDTAGLSHTLAWVVEVANVNQRPVVTPVPEQTWVEHEPVHLVIEATDPDVGDRLTFTDTSSMFDIDPVLGVINFTPLQLHVGPHTVTVRVQDLDGATTTVTIDVQVLGVNDPPQVSIRVESLKDRLEEGDMLGLAAVVTDDDSDRDDLLFTWLFDGKEKGNEDSIVLRGLGAGKHQVELRVNDGDNTVSSTYDFDVRAIEEPTPWGAIVALIVVLVVVLVVMMRVVLPRLRGNGGEGEGPEG